MPYECHKHGVLAGDHCPQCTVHCYMPIPMSTPSALASQPAAEGVPEELPDRPGVNESEGYTSSNKTYRWKWVYADEFAEWGDQVERIICDLRKERDELRQELLQTHENLLIVRMDKYAGLSTPEAASALYSLWQEALHNPHEAHPENITIRDLRRQIAALVQGMRSWAADEDGIHPDACKAYTEAMTTLRYPFASETDREALATATAARGGEEKQP